MKVDTNKKELIFKEKTILVQRKIGQDFDEDPRLKAMEEEWFEGKDCLDIGCNSGVITIAIAQKFNCRSIFGVDIDDGSLRGWRWSTRGMLIFSRLEVVNQRDADLLAVGDGQPEGC